MGKRLDEQEAVSVMRAGGLEPMEAYPGAGKRWRCCCQKCGNQVAPTLISVRNGHKCRYCARRAIPPEDARLIMRDAGLEPLAEYPGASKPWLCRCTTCGNEVSPTLGTIKTGSGCRYCAKVAILPEEAERVMRDAGLEPLEPYLRNASPWRCQCLTCGREIAPSYANVRNGGGGCKYCAGRVVDEADAVQVMLDAGLQPLDGYPGFEKPWRCRCQTCGNEVTPTYGHVRWRGRGCLHCGIERTRAARLLDSGKAIAAMRRFHLEPNEPFLGANEPWLCTCATCGQEFTTTYHSVVRRRWGCRDCTPGANADAHQAERFMRSLGLEPLEDYPGAAAGWRCRCTSCGELSSRIYANAKARGSGCGKCRQKAKWEARAAEAVEFMRGRGFEPLEPYPGSGEPWRCRCVECDREVRPRRQSVKRGSGCRYCATRRRIDPETAAQEMRANGLEPAEPFPGTGRLWNCVCTDCRTNVRVKYAQGTRTPACPYCQAQWSTDPAAAEDTMRSAGFEPLAPYPGSNNPWKCRCMECGRESAPRHSNVRNGTTCVYCARRRVDPTEAAAVMRRSDLEPIDPFPGASLPWKCRCCKCGSEVFPRYGAVVRGGSGCKYCAPYGFDPDGPAVLYLLTHPKWGAHKIGITAPSARRLEQHSRRGWTIVESMQCPDGRTARRIEAMILHWWRRELRMEPHLRDGDGWTETIDADAVSLTEVWDRVLSEYERARQESD